MIRSQLTIKGMTYYNDNIMESCLRATVALGDDRTIVVYCYGDKSVYPYHVRGFNHDKVISTNRATIDSMLAASKKANRFAKLWILLNSKNDK